MSNLEKELKIALDNEKIRVWQEPGTDKAMCDIGGRPFVFTNLKGNVAVEDFATDELAEMIAEAITVARRDFSISNEKASYYRTLLTEICHGVYYAKYDKDQSFVAWFENY